MTHSDAIVLCAAINTADVRPIRDGWHAEPKLCAMLNKDTQLWDGEWQAVLDHRKSKHAYMLKSLEEWNAFCEWYSTHQEDETP